MDYQNFELEKLVRDPYFRRSVLVPDEQSSRFWSEWIAVSPLNREKYEQARLIVIAFHETYHEGITDAEISKRSEEIASKKNTRTGSRKVKPGGWQTGMRWAAAVALLLLAGSVLLWTRYGARIGEDTVVFDHKEAEAPAEPAAAPYPEEILRENNTNANLTLMLSDSSVVTLLPGSRLKFPAVFGQEDRKVLLSGDAFFEVTSNPDAPFLVYAGETVVKVLGTTFRVTALEKENKVTVKVLSGRVSVYSFADFSGNARAKEMVRQGVYLTPNEEVVVDRTAKTVEKVKMASRLEEIKRGQTRELIFDDTPIADIFLEFERTYGMEIEFDRDSFRKCPITTYFKEESLLERINTICQAVGATYRPENGKIIVSGIDCTGYKE